MRRRIRRAVMLVEVVTLLAVAWLVSVVAGAPSDRKES